MGRTPPPDGMADLSRALERLAAALAAGGRVVWESEEHWTLADQAGNRVDITAWPDGATKAPPDPA